jgi:hypothetical protein
MDKETRAIISEDQNKQVNKVRAEFVKVTAGVNVATELSLRFKP